ncbi:MULTISPECIES: hypothetical protein [unclassified Rhizobium]|uniref:hypothetical protein n=1 Tax=unclassified Rhizobium TaxID=2613769 RepID=UPI001AD9C62D|nr:MULTISPECIES: hypothetical protein [unclassified Rhizobium]MBO9122281.1 hypothetical protein [Rhizobium sp. 16-488-2b]MBO9172649.1 hypothetical protein [Rhizobium sp. 16-488-2a]
MLSPVRAASSSSFPSQGSTSALSASDIVRSVAAVAPVNQVESPDLTSGATAKLNILLLAVRARMVEALLNVLTATGEALSQPRDDNEPDLVFAARLADAIQKLPAAKIEVIERQLAAQGHAIPLRLLAEALQNPAGPAATRIAAYLETIGTRDRDLATRAVLKSYSQNDGSPVRPEQRPEISLHRDTVTSAPRATTAATDSAGARNAAMAAASGAIGHESEVTAQTVVTDDAPMPPAAERAEPKAAMTAASATLSTDEAAEAPVAAEASALPAEAEATEVAAEPTAARDTKADPIIPKSWVGIPASLSKDETAMIVVIIRDQATETLLEATDVEPAVDIDVLLDDTLIADIPDNLKRPAEQMLMANGLVKPMTPQAAPSPLEAVAAQAAARQPTQADTDTPSATRQMIDATYAPVLMKVIEGVPYAPQPYDFAKDETDDAGSREMNREDHNGNIDQGDENEDAEQDGADEAETLEEQVLAADDDAAFMAAQQSAIAAPILDEMGEPILMLPGPGLPMAPASDEAYARYRRMVGWE